MTKRPSTEKDKAAPTAKQDRLADALRTNLLKRKAQKRARGPESGGASRPSTMPSKSR